MQTSTKQSAQANSNLKSNLALIEEEMLKIWSEEGTFAASLEQRQGGKVFSFYDGPPFANGLPHFGHSLVTSIKDSLGRYKTMQGYYVERRNGWDCHGLPVEFAIEKQFGVSGKKQVLELGLEKFNAACRDSVFLYKTQWEEFFARIGRWTDTKNSYATIDKNYTESVWWSLKQIHEKGLLYKGFKCMPYCPRCETPLSNFEVNEGYKDNTPDPSLFVKFKLTDEDAYLLGWTTTPWSLPGNAAIAVKPEAKYVYVEYSDNKNPDPKVLVVAKNRLAVLEKGQTKIIKEVLGTDLVGKSYQPLFAVEGIQRLPNSTNLYKVWEADFVSIEDGTGVLHVAPAFGEDDLHLGQTNNIPVLKTLGSDGRLVKVTGIEDLENMFFKEADKAIVQYLKAQCAIFASESISHTYPFCYRCDSPLLYYAISTWFVKVSAIKQDLLDTAAEISWMPEHIKAGRFGKWLEGARDWAVSRNRYWGAPMPIWANTEDETDYIVIGSLAELTELTGQGSLPDLHRPFIDQVSFTKDGKTYKRVEEVLDCWFESGSMPVAQQHYPFENKEKFEAVFPADYIGEGLDQTRLWFYVLHVISTILFKKPAYKQVLVSGMILATDGNKLSKRLKNYPPVEEVFGNEGADSLRLYLLSNNQLVTADYMRFNRDSLKDLNRNVLGTLMNSYRFFKMYADLDTWKPTKTLTAPQPNNVLDQWILARLDETIESMTTHADHYELAHAVQSLFGLIDDLSNWYIRRSRRRFWKSESDSNKADAYTTLHYVLVVTSQLLAPWAPFLSDKLYRDLTSGMDVSKSVHLSDWPKTNPSLDKTVLEAMTKARSYINEGLSQRATAKLKVRQPLSSVTAPLLPEEFKEIIADELNVKKVVWLSEKEENKVTIDSNLTDELKAEGIMRELVRCIQNARKEAGFQISDRIRLIIQSTNTLVQAAITTHAETIKNEVLAVSLEQAGTLAFVNEAKIDGEKVTLCIEKVGE